MASKFCIEELSEQLSLVDSHRGFIEAFCIFNLTFALIAALENLLVFHALWKSSTIPATVKKLFLSLVVSDFVAGILAQLMFGVIIAVILKKTSNGDQSIASFCPTILNLCYFLLVLLCSASFLTITAIAVDRLLSISLHLRYRELVTPKRVIIVLMALWLTSGTTGSLFIILSEHSNKVTAIVESIGLCLNTVAYIRIYEAVRYHQHQMKCHLRLQNSNLIDILRQRKSALNALVVYLVFLVCYLPYIFTIILLLVLDSEDTSLLLAERASLTLIFLNSSVNLLVYCWRYREIRDSVKSTLKKLFLHEQEWDRRLCKCLCPTYFPETSV